MSVRGQRKIFESLNVIQKVRKIACPKYSQFSSREKSFDNESLTPFVQYNRKVLAEAGFFSNGKEDESFCYYCGGGIKYWQEDDDPWRIHAIYFDCPFVYLMKGKEFVDKCCSTRNDKLDCGKVIESIEDEDSYEDFIKCAICLTETREILFLPCKHCAVCTNCSLRLDSCIACRSKITGLVRIYLV